MPKLTTRNSQDKLNPMPAIVSPKVNKELDTLLALMQTPKAKRALEAAFKASPEELGRAAVKAAQKDRSPGRKKSRRLSTSA